MKQNVYAKFTVLVEWHEKFYGTNPKKQEDLDPDNLCLGLNALSHESCNMDVGPI